MNLANLFEVDWSLCTDARAKANDHWWRVTLILSRHGAARWALGSDFWARYEMGLK